MWIGADRGGILWRDVGDEIVLPRNEAGVAEQRLGNELHLDAVEIGGAVAAMHERRRPRVIGSLHERDALLSRVTLDDEGPGADRAVGEALRIFTQGFG